MDGASPCASAAGRRGAAAPVLPAPSAAGCKDIGSRKASEAPSTPGPPRSFTTGCSACRCPMPPWHAGRRGSRGPPWPACIPPCVAACGCAAVSRGANTPHTAVEVGPSPPAAGAPGATLCADTGAQSSSASRDSTALLASCSPATGSDARTGPDLSARGPAELGAPPLFFTIRSTWSNRSSSARRLLPEPPFLLVVTSARLWPSRCDCGWAPGVREGSPPRSPDRNLDPNRPPDPGVLYASALASTSISTSVMASSPPSSGTGGSPAACRARSAYRWNADVRGAPAARAEGADVDVPPWLRRRASSCSRRSGHGAACPLP